MKHVARIESIITAKEKRCGTQLHDTFFWRGQKICSVCSFQVSFRLRSASSTAAPPSPSLHRSLNAFGDGAHAAKRGSRLEYTHASERKMPHAKAYGTFLAEDKRFEIRLRRFTLSHEVSKSQVLSHFCTFAFHQLSQHFTKTMDK